MRIKLAPVASSLITAAGYDPATKTLALQFQKKSGPGSIYHYQNVTPETYQQFMASESKGHFFGQHIKDKEDYPHTKIEPEKEDDEGEAAVA